MMLEKLKDSGWIFSWHPYAYEFRLDAVKGDITISGLGETNAVAEANCLKQINKYIIETKGDI